MLENLALVWPPSRTRTLLQPLHSTTSEHELSLQSNFTVPPILSTPRDTTSTSDRALLSSAPRKQWQNGYEKAPKAISFEPYAMSKRGASKRASFFLETNTYVLKPLPPLTVPQWNALAHNVGLLPVTFSMRTFQMQGSNLVIARKKDLILISPTGSGKSVLFSAALHAQKHGISIVVTPYTSLGKEGATK